MKRDSLTPDALSTERVLAVSELVAIDQVIPKYEQKYREAVEDDAAVRRQYTDKIAAAESYDAKAVALETRQQELRAAMNGPNADAAILELGGIPQQIAAARQAAADHREAARLFLASSPFDVTTAKVGDTLRTLTGLKYARARLVFLHVVGSFQVAVASALRQVPGLLAEVATFNAAFEARFSTPSPLANFESLIGFFLLAQMKQELPTKAAEKFASPFSIALSQNPAFASLLVQIDEKTPRQPVTIPELPDTVH